MPGPIDPPAPAAPFPVPPVFAPEPVEHLRHYVFVYGTLKRGGGWHHLLADSRFIDTGATVDRYPLLVGRLPYLLDEAGVGEHIQGELYKVSDETASALDLLEQHPDWYQRRVRAVRPDHPAYLHQLFGAHIYFLTAPCYAHIDWRAMPMHASYPLPDLDAHD